MTSKKAEPSLPEKVTEIKGKWGKGGQGIGNLFCLEEAALFDLKAEHEGQVLALRRKLSRGVWYKAKSLGVKGIIAGSLPDEEFSQEAEKEVLEVGDKKKRFSLPLVVLGGQSEIPDETWQKLKAKEGKKVIVEGNKKRILIPNEA